MKYKYYPIIQKYNRIKVTFIGLLIWSKMTKKPKCVNMVVLIVKMGSPIPLIKDLYKTRLHHHTIPKRPTIIQYHSNLPNTAPFTTVVVEVPYYSQGGQLQLMKIRVPILIIPLVCQIILGNNRDPVSAEVAATDLFPFLTAPTNKIIIIMVALA